jgi:hypothetical protein
MAQKFSEIRDAEAEAAKVSAESTQAAVDADSKAKADQDASRAKTALFVTKIAKAGGEVTDFALKTVYYTTNDGKAFLTRPTVGMDDDAPPDDDAPADGGTTPPVPAL